MDHVIRGLGRLGDVDVVNFTDPWRESGRAAVPDSVRRWVELERPQCSPVRRWLSFFRPGGLPLSVAGQRRWRGANPGEIDDRYDLVWVHRVETFWLLGPGLPAGRRVVDLVDLEDYKTLARADLRHTRAGSSGRAKPRRLAGTLVTTKDARAWRRLQSAMGSRADVVVVPSALDAERIVGIPEARVRVVPNGADDPGTASRRPEDGRSGNPAVVFFGLLTYPPNVDAAVFLAQEVGPELRRRIPGVTIRLVGRPSDRVKALHSPPDLEVAGFVPDLGAELAGADIALVPIRYGGGTRIKILDAWAHGIPVVTTSAGAEGLDVRHRENALVADTPAGLAEACQLLVADPALRESLVSCGRRSFERSHNWNAIEQTVARVAGAVATGRPDPDPEMAG